MSPEYRQCKDIIRRVIAHLERHPHQPLEPELQRHLDACRSCHGRVRIERNLRAQGVEELSCEEVIERLFDYLDRELDDRMRHRINHHLETCRGCFSRVEFEQRLRAKLNDAAEVQAPERLRKRIEGVMEKFQADL